MYELRAMIDRGWMDRAATLARSHPAAMRSRHITHNLGRARSRALDRYLAATARSARSEKPDA
ncbi:MAG TPA: hypothetical protein VFX15_03080 [Actinomycetes bacterium]|nr:hypothetical protein [Actinomycetes bacterium]